MVQFSTKIDKNQIVPKRSIDRIHAYNIVTPALLDCVLGTQQLCGTVSFGTSGTTENSGFSGSITLREQS